ncbi:hypothetical protein [Microtetraspora fusca]|nr:hypothetical protein [Microtetraspora fusca]
MLAWIFDKHVIEDRVNAPTLSPEHTVLVVTGPDVRAPSGMA